MMKKAILGAFIFSLSFATFIPVVSAQELDSLLSEEAVAAQPLKKKEKTKKIKAKPEPVVDNRSEWVKALGINLVGFMFIHSIHGHSDLFVPWTKVNADDQMLEKANQDVKKQIK